MGSPISPLSGVVAGGRWFDFASVQYVEVDDVDALHARAKEKEVRILEPLWNAWWGLRQFTIADPEGNADATVTGVQNDTVVSTQTVSVTDAVGGGATRYTFQSYIPDATGDIVWTAVINDGDPDTDAATATTVVNR